MIDSDLIDAALRARAVSAVFATTGSIAMSATATGYARTPVAGSGTLAANAGAGTFSVSQAGVIVNGSVVTVASVNYVVSNFNGTTTCTLSGTPTFSAVAFTYTGSFIVDGFWPGMEIAPSGFAANTVAAITAVTARTITTVARAAESTASGRTLLVGLPALVAWENEDITVQRIAGRPYMTVEYSPSTHVVPFFPVNHSHADETGLYVLKLFGISGVGRKHIDKYINGLRALFAPGTQLTAGANTVRIRTDVAPSPGPLIPQTGGWTVCMLPIHWSARSLNTIAA